MRKMRRMIISLLACTCLLCSCGQTAATASEPAVTNENQAIVTGQITEVYGNDITLALAEEVSQDSGSGRNGNGFPRPSGENGNNSQSPSQETTTGTAGVTKSAMQGDSAGYALLSADMAGGSGGQMPEGGGGPGGQMPNGSEFPGGQMPNGSEFPGGQMPGGGTITSGTEGETGSSEDTQTAVIYSLTGETFNTLIPVGTKVTTQLGTITTFSRLAVGDMVKMLMETAADGNQVAIAIWIVG